MKPLSPEWRALSLKLIKCLVALVVTIILALGLVLFQDVSESQGYTYSPAPELSQTAGSTKENVVGRTESATTTQLELIDIDDIEPVYGKTSQTVELDKEYIKERIRQVFPEEPVMVYVAACESGFDPLADREGRNVDVGLFQINQVHLPRVRALGLDRRDLEDNLTFARMLYDESGLQPWFMSEHCWSRYL